MKLSDSILDCVEIAQILFIYRMRICLDGKRVVDSYVVSLVENEEGWRAFPWELWSFNILLYQMFVVITSPSEVSNQGLVHKYGPMWVLKVIILHLYYIYNDLNTYLLI